MAAAVAGGDDDDAFDLAAEEVAGVVLYLSSELSGNVTGTHIVVDGGRSGSGGAPATRRT